MFQTMQAPRKETLDDFKEVITAMTTNKGLGMMDSEWKKIVQTNAQRERDEAARAKQKLIEQQRRMKAEL